MRRRTPRRWLGEGLLLGLLSAAVAAYGRSARVVVDAVGHLEAGRPEAALRRVSGLGEHDPVAAYIRGCAHLELDAPTAAIDPLTVAATAGGPELQRRAWHNLSVAHLLVAMERSGEVKRFHAEEAAAAAIRSLRLDPGSAGTRWNLALAWQILEEGEEGSPGGERTPGVSGRGGAGPARRRGAAGAMTREEAARVLDALRSAEGSRAVQGILEGPDEGASGSTHRRGPPW